MAAYLDKAKEQLSLFSPTSIDAIPRSKNLNVDALAKLASTRVADLLDALLKYATPSEAKYIMREIHEGTYGNHTGGQSLAFKALRQGDYWTTMKMDYMEYARKCNKCQRFEQISKAHPKELTSTTSPWPFFV